MKKSFYIAAGLCMVAASTAASAAPSDAELMTAATDLGHRYDANYAAKDPQAMAELYAVDGILVSPAGPIIKGRTALRAYYVKRFASGAKAHHITIEEVHTQGDGGYAVAKFSVQTSDSHGALHTQSGSLVAIYQHDADGWHLRLVEPSVPESHHS